MPVSGELAGHAGELIGTNGTFRVLLCIDAMVAATGLALERLVVLLTSDPDGLSRLLDEPGHPKAQRVAVMHA